MSRTGQTDNDQEPDRGRTFGESQQSKVERRRRATAAVIHDTILSEGEEELERPVSSLFWSAVAAGLAMGFSLAVEGLLWSGLPDTGWRPLVANLGYTVGFLIVVLGRQQLFTETTLTVVLPVLHRKTWSTLKLMLRLWGGVLVANVIGTLVYAAVAAHTEAFSPEARQAFGEIGRHAAEPGFWVTLLRAIVAGWLIALMVWLLPEAGAASPFVIVVITYVVGLAGLAHVIAGSTEVSYAAFIGIVSWSEFAFGFFVPALLGNIIGGVTLVAVLNHGQVQAGQED